MKSLQWTWWAAFLILAALTPAQWQIATAEVDHRIAIDGDIRIRVSIRSNIVDAHSCQHSFTQLELVNMHKSQSVQIRSVQTSTEETVHLSDGTTFDDLPQQFHISKLPGGTLTLGPGQIAMVPLSFLPRFPPTSNAYDGFAPRYLSDNVSLYVQADWMEWMARSTPPRRNHRQLAPDGTLLVSDSPESFKVSTEVIVDAGGMLIMPVTATSVRHNEFSLPDVIYFDVPEQESYDYDVVFQNGEVHFRKGKAMASAEKKDSSVNKLANTIYVADASDRKEGSRDIASPLPHEQEDCYDLFFQHPWFEYEDEEGFFESSYDANDIEILEVGLSKFNFMSLEIIPEKAASTERELEYIAQTRQQIIRKWTDRGPLIIPADGRQHYLLTICASSDHVIVSDANAVDNYLEDVTQSMKSGSNEKNLGYLQIKTAALEPLFVALEKRPDPSRNLMDLKSKSANATESVNALQATPNALDIQLLSSSTRTATATLDVSNPLSSEVKLMRASVAFRTQNSMKLDELGIKVRVTMRESGKRLAPGETSKEAVIVRVALNLQLFKEKAASDDSEFDGAMIIRATRATRLSYHEWESSSRINRGAGTEEVLEVPIKLKILRGRLGLSVTSTNLPYNTFWILSSLDSGEAFAESMFYPLRTQDGPAALFNDIEHHRSELPDKWFDHLFDVYSSIGGDVQVERAEIVDENHNAVDMEADSSLCTRFDVTFTTEIRQDPEEPGFVTLGSVFLRYSFPQPGVAGKEKFMRNQTYDIFPCYCYLRLTTTPDTGNHLTPLLVFAGHVDASDNLYMDLPASDSAKEDAGLRSPWHSTAVGFDRVFSWFHSSSLGSALRTALDGSFDSRSSIERDSVLLGRYLYSLAKQSIDLESSNLRPVLFEVGAIPQGDVETVPLYLTNHNPVPIIVSIDVGEVEGLSIELGRDRFTVRGDGNSPLDLLPPRPVRNGIDVNLLKSDSVPLSQRFQGQPVAGLMHFLSSSESVSRFFGQLPYRDSVVLNSFAAKTAPLLKNLYTRYAGVRFHRSKHAGTSGPNPPLFGSFDRSCSGRLQGPAIISSDNTSCRRTLLPRRKESENNSTSSRTIIIPPGGTARFDVRIRSPPAAVLSTDITSFLATGLVLSTNFGEVIPVLVVFDSLQGRLDISHIPASGGSLLSNLSNCHINIPAGLFQTTSPSSNATVHLSPVGKIDVKKVVQVADAVQTNLSSDEISTPLYMHSTFSRDVRVLEIQSCNPWFEVELTHSSESAMDGILGTRIGFLRSVMSCDDEDRDLSVPGFPSFFQCALKWLEKRFILQPIQCGQTSETDLVFDVESNEKEMVTIEQATHSIRRATIASGLKRMPTRYPQLPPTKYFTSLERRTKVEKSGMRNRDGSIPLSVYDAFVGALQAWESVSNMGGNVVRTTLRAVLEYNRTGKVSKRGRQYEIEKSTISMAIANVSVASTLQIPSLIDPSAAGILTQADLSLPVLQLPPAHVGEMTSIMIPLRNPTAAPLRVSIIVPPLARAHSNDGGRSTFEHNAHQRFTMGYTAPYVQSAGRSSSLGQDLANRQWWDLGGGFFLADYDGNMIRSHHNNTLRSGVGAQASIVNPSFLYCTAFSVGCDSRCGIREDPGKKYHGDALVDLRPSSPIGASAAAGYTLIGRKRGNLNGGFRDNDGLLFEAGGSIVTGGSGPSAFAIPFSALDELTIPPFARAEIGPILFRPPGKTKFLGCRDSLHGVQLTQCANDGFESMVILENSLSGLERVIVKGVALWDRAVFMDPEPDGTNDSFGDIELRNGHQTLAFRGFATRRDANPESKKVLFHNAGDTPLVVKRVFLSESVRINGKWIDSKRHCRLNGFRVRNCSALENSFLRPGESLPIFVSYVSSCTKLKDYLTLSAEIEFYSPHVSAPGVSSSKTKKVVERLMVGFEMNHRELSGCVALLGEEDCEDIWSSQEGTIEWDDSLQGLLPSILFSVICVVLVMMMLSGFKVDCMRMRRHERIAVRDPCINGMFDVGSNNGTTAAARDWMSFQRELSYSELTVSDLHLYCREETKELLYRFKSLGMIAPQCVSSSGLLCRERKAITSSNSATQRGAPGNSEKGRTLSDIIFLRFTPNRDGINGIMPCELQWRTAAARGAALESDLYFASSRSGKLWSQRAAQSYDILMDSDSFDSEGESAKQVLIEKESASSSTTIVEFETSDSPPVSGLQTQLDVGEVMEQTVSTLSSGDKHAHDVVSHRQSRDAAKVKSKPLKLHDPDHKPAKLFQGKDDVVKSEKVRGRMSLEKVIASPGQDTRMNSSQTEMESRTKRASDKRSNIVSVSLLEKTASQPRRSPIKTKAVKSNDSNALPPTSTWAEKMTKTTPVGVRLRPPPGLGPPPGFAETTEDDIDQGSASFGESGVVYAPSSVSHTSHGSIGRSRSEESLIRSNPTSPKISYRMPPNSQSPGSISKLSPIAQQLGGTASTPKPLDQEESGFDILDFLDGILNDGTASSDEDERRGMPLVAESPITESAISNAVPILSNPWASSSDTRSRAAAYGIPIDENMANQSHVFDSGDMPALPLMSPADILSTAQEVDHDDERISSFFRDLLND